MTFSKKKYEVISSQQESMKGQSPQGTGIRSSKHAHGGCHPVK